MDAQDGLAATSFGEIYRDLPVETPRSQQGWIEHVRAVRGGKDDDSLIGLEAIQLHQQLLQRLFPFIIAGISRCSTARSPNRVDFIDKDDTRSVLSTSQCFFSVISTLIWPPPSRSKRV